MPEQKKAASKKPPRKRAKAKTVTQRVLAAQDAQFYREYRRFCRKMNRYAHDIGMSVDPIGDKDVM